MGASRLGWDVDHQSGSQSQFDTISPLINAFLSSAVNEVPIDNFKLTRDRLSFNRCQQFCGIDERVRCAVR